MLSLIRVLEIIRNALFCSRCNFIKYVCGGKPRPARHKGIVNEQENNIIQKLHSRLET